MIKYSRYIFFITDVFCSFFCFFRSTLHISFVLPCFIYYFGLAGLVFYLPTDSICITCLRSVLKIK